MPRRFTVNEKAAQAWALLKAKGWDIHDLARETGLKFDAVRFIFYRYQNCLRRAWKIERVLGAPIWTPTDQFQQLTAATEAIGTDFVLTGFHVLRKRATAAGVPGTRRITNKSDLLRAILTHTGKNPAPISSHEKAHHLPRRH